MFPLHSICTAKKLTLQNKLHYRIFTLHSMYTAECLHRIVFTLQKINTQGEPLTENDLDLCKTFATPKGTYEFLEIPAGSKTPTSRPMAQTIKRPCYTRPKHSRQPAPAESTHLSKLL